MEKKVFLSPKKIASVALLPGILPRLKNLFGGFDYLPFLIARLYGGIGLLPRTHPYLNSNNIGRYGIIRLLAEAGRHTKWNKENIDKALIYSVTLLSACIVLVFIVSAVLYTIVSPVWALGFLITPDPENDLSYDILNQTFGIEGIFDPSFTTSSPLHFALHAMLRMYSNALVIFGIVIFLYYIVTITAETAISGKPFGEKFHKVWGPLRLVTALGLLIPFGSTGLNSAQYIVLYAAKFGSGMATNAWIAFNKSSAQPYGFGSTYTDSFPSKAYLTQESILDKDPTKRRVVSHGDFKTNGLIALPKMPDISDIAGFMSLIHTCKAAYKYAYGYKTAGDESSGLLYDIRPYAAKSNPSESIDLSDTSETSFEDLLEFYGNDDVIIYFGKKDEESYASQAGNVKPYCGSIVIPAVEGQFTSMDKFRATYYDLIITLGFREDLPQLYYPASYFAKHVVSKNLTDWKIKPDICDEDTNGDKYPNAGYTTEYQMLGECDQSSVDYANHMAFFVDEAQYLFDKMAYARLKTMMAEGELFEISDDILKLGWGGAGISYNRITELSGETFRALRAVPLANTLPEIMEIIQKHKSLNLGDDAESADFFPTPHEGQTLDLPSRDKAIATALAIAHKNIGGQLSAASDRKLGQRYSIIARAVATVFGATPLLSMRDNVNIHPFAQLVGVGRGLIENAIAALGVAAGASFLGGAADAAVPGLGQAFSGKAALAKAIAFTGLAGGFLLFYIVPFLPFLYFFFAVSVWVKTIFEALVGAPLWALAHMNIEGDSFMSKQALGGYFLTFEVFLRPVMVLLGLISSAAIFGACIYVLNITFELVTANLTGYDIPTTGLNKTLQVDYMRGELDQLFFTIMYVILVYMFGSSCFKLVDDIPNNITRWMSGGVKSFGDMAKDPAEQLTTYASLAAYRYMPRISDGLTQASTALGSGVGGAAAEPIRNLARSLGGGGAAAAGAGATGADAAQQAAAQRAAEQQQQGQSDQRNTQPQPPAEAPQESGTQQPTRNENGELIDSEGRRINDAGELVNDSGQRINEAGQLVDENGQPITDEAQTPPEDGGSR